MCSVCSVESRIAKCSGYYACAFDAVSALRAALDDCRLCSKFFNIARLGGRNDYAIDDVRNNCGDYDGYIEATVCNGDFDFEYHAC
jgi:hypothetical protein